MARPDERDKPLKRTRRPTAALSQGGLAESADALLGLSAGERERGAASIAVQLADEHERLLCAHEFALLLAWRARCEREPRLLPANDGARVRWCWLIAAIRTRSWPLAQAIFLELEAALLGWSQRATLSSLVMNEGRPEPSALAALVSESLRLGYELPVKRMDHPCPARVEDVQVACLTCFAQEPWPRFRTLVNEWLECVPADVAREILPLAVALSRRELAVQVSRDPAAALEVARCCALWCLRAERPSAMESVISLCVRIAAQQLHGTVVDRHILQACTPIIQASLGYPSLIEAVTHVVLAPCYAHEVADAALLLLRPFVEQGPNPRVLFKLAALVATQEQHGQKPIAPPPWLARAFERALENPASVNEVLRAPTAHDAASYLFAVLPLALSVRACIALFPSADESTRELLAKVAEVAARRMREKLAANAASPGVRELRAASVPKAWRAELERFALPLLSYSLGLLEELLMLCQDAAEERALATRFWSRRTRLSARFDALLIASERGYARSVAVLERELLCAYRADTVDAAQALLRAERCGASRSLRKKIAEVLLAVLADSPAVAVEPRLAEAIRFARRLSKPRTPTASKRKRAPQAAKPQGRTGSSKRLAGQRQAASFR